MRRWAAPVNSAPATTAQQAPTITGAQSGAITGQIGARNTQAIAPAIGHADTRIRTILPAGQTLQRRRYTRARRTPINNTARTTAPSRPAAPTRAPIYSNALQASATPALRHIKSGQYSANHAQAINTAQQRTQRRRLHHWQPGARRRTDRTLTRQHAGRASHRRIRHVRRLRTTQHRSAQSRQAQRPPRHRVHHRSIYSAGHGSGAAQAQATRARTAQSRHRSQQFDTGQPQSGHNTDHCCFCHAHLHRYNIADQVNGQQSCRQAGQHNGICHNNGAPASASANNRTSTITAPAQYIRTVRHHLRRRITITQIRHANRQSATITTAPAHADRTAHTRLRTIAGCVGIRAPTAYNH